MATGAIDHSMESKNRTRPYCRYEFPEQTRTCKLNIIVSRRDFWSEHVQSLTILQKRKIKEKKKMAGSYQRKEDAGGGAGAGGCKLQWQRSLPPFSASGVGLWLERLEEFEFVATDCFSILCPLVLPVALLCGELLCTTHSLEDLTLIQRSNVCRVMEFEICQIFNY